MLQQDILDQWDPSDRTDPTDQNCSMKKLCSILILCPILLSANTVSEQEAWQLGWPQLRGPYGNYNVAQIEAEIVSDLSKAKFIWESETRDFGRAKHTTGAFKGRTPEDKVQKVLDILGPEPKATAGSWASPIIAEGKLFASTFKPAGKLYDVKTYEFSKDPNKLTAKAHLEADDIVIAMDALTGKTVWQASEPGGFVWGVGKRMGFQVTPVYHDGKVFSMGTTGRIFAYNSKDGTKIWQTEAEEKMLAEKKKHLADPNILQASRNYGWVQALVFAEGHLIVPRGSTLLCLDPETGKEVWALEKVTSNWVTPSIWNHKRKEYLLVTNGRNPGTCVLQLIDPSKGKVLWTLDGLDSTQFNIPVAESHVLVNVGSKILKEKPNASTPKYKDGTAPYGRLAAYKLSLEGAELVWELPDQPQFLLPTWSDTLARPRYMIKDGLVYISTEGPDKNKDRRFIVAELCSGKVLVNEPRQHDFWFQLIGDKLFHCIDWCHGKSASFNMYSSSPKSFKHLSGPWRTKELLTTSYQVLMEPPIIAGRIFLRTETGTVVCYDVRKSK